MPNNVDICNKALLKIGERFITSLLDDNTAARACNKAYQPCLTEMLISHPWNFALKRAALAADVATPVWGYSNQFTIPSDSLRLWRIENDPIRSVEGDKILINASGPLNVLYIFNNQDTTQYSAKFIEALALRIAVEIVDSLTSSNTRKQTLYQELDAALSEAKRFDSQENIPEDYVEDDWVTIRI